MFNKLIHSSLNKKIVRDRNVPHSLSNLVNLFILFQKKQIVNDCKGSKLSIFIYYANTFNKHTQVVLVGRDKAVF